MINLLPRHKKKELRTMYRLRVAVISLMFVIAFELLLVFMFFPSFYNVYITLNELTQKLEEKKTGIPKDVEDIQKQVTRLKGEIDLLKGVGGISPLGILDKVIGAKNDGITIWGVTYEQTSGAIQLRGFASTRDSLTQYRKQLREIPEFKSAEFPPSLLLKDNEIDFPIKIDMKK